MEDPDRDPEAGGRNRAVTVTLWVFGVLLVLAVGVALWEGRRLADVCDYAIEHLEQAADKVKAENQQSAGLNQLKTVIAQIKSLCP